MSEKGVNLADSEATFFKKWQKSAGFEINEKFNFSGKMECRIKKCQSFLQKKMSHGCGKSYVLSS